MKCENCITLKAKKKSYVTNNSQHMQKKLFHCIRPFVKREIFHTMLPFLIVVKIVFIISTIYILCAWRLDMIGKAIAPNVYKFVEEQEQTEQLLFRIYLSVCVKLES